MIRWPDTLIDLLEPIDSVCQHVANPNSGDPELLAELIEVHGFYAPVQAQRSTGYIVAGNTRYEALLSLGSPSIPVVWLDIDDEQALRILLSDNKSSRVARMDPALEKQALLALADTDRALLGTGYHPNDILRLAKITDDPLPEPAAHLQTDTSPGHGMAHKCPHCGEYFG